jgi:hypothetical protein
MRFERAKTSTPAFGYGREKSRLRLCRSHIGDKNGIVIARLPLLVLSATHYASWWITSRRLRERLPDVSGDVTLPPSVTVVQYATGTSGFSSLRLEGKVARLLSEIERERR